MSDLVSLDVEVRDKDKLGTNYSRKLRKSGKLPAVIYGHKEETVSLAIPAESFVRALQHGARVMELKSNGKTEQTLIRDVQWDVYGIEVLHVDFERVSADERKVVEVALETKGDCAGVAAGNVLDIQMHNLELECPATKIPGTIQISVTALELGQAIHVKDLELPEGVKALADPEALVLHVIEPKEEVEETSEQAEPEVIGKPAEEEEGGE